jgi:hypothetical protein
MAANDLQKVKVKNADGKSKSEKYNRKYLISETQPKKTP